MGTVYEKTIWKDEWLVICDCGKSAVGIDLISATFGWIMEEHTLSYPRTICIDCLRKIEVKNEETLQIIEGIGESQRFLEKMRRITSLKGRKKV